MQTRYSIFNYICQENNIVFIAGTLDGEVIMIIIIRRRRAVETQCTTVSHVGVTDCVIFTFFTTKSKK